MRDGKKIIKQAPKPTKEKFKTWEDLNKILDSKFHKDPHNHKNVATIGLHDYKIDKQEIIGVLEEKGYATELGEERDNHQYLKISLKN